MLAGRIGSPLHWVSRAAMLLVLTLLVVLDFDEAEAEGWTVLVIKNDLKRLVPFDQPDKKFCGVCGSSLNTSPALRFASPGYYAPSRSQDEIRHRETVSGCARIAPSLE